MDQAPYTGCPASVDHSACAGDVDPLVLPPGARHIHPGGEVDNGFMIFDRRTYGRCIGNLAPYLRQSEAAGAALQDGDGVTPRGKCIGDSGAQHAARPGDQDLHGRPARPPASTRSAQLASRVRSTLEACRMSTGSASTTRTAASGIPAAARTAPVSRSSARTPLDVAG